MNSILQPETPIDATAAHPPTVGLPADRLARLAARRAFVELKQMFLRSVEPLRGAKAEWLRSKIRLANEPGDLWVLRGPLLRALHGIDSREGRELRSQFHRAIDSAFVDSIETRPMHEPVGWIQSGTRLSPAALTQHF